MDKLITTNKSSHKCLVALVGTIASSDFLEKGGGKR